MRGNLILIAATALHKEDQTKLTSVTLLSGAECYVREDILIFDDVLDVKIGETWKIGYKSAQLKYLHIWDYTLHLLI